MKKTFLVIVLITVAQCVHMWAQAPKDTIPPGSVLLANYEGRTPCNEMMLALDVGSRPECAKRKLALALYVDSITRKPTFYRSRGLGIRTGTGKWSIEKGTPSNPQAVVYRLNMGEVSWLLFKGDEQVLFVLDKQKNFLVGNAQYSYTLNRVMNQQSWDNWRERIHKGLPF